MAASSASGYDFEFLVDEIPPDYECPICMMVLRDPQMVSCCGRKFCKGCIDRVINQSKPCPYCKESFCCMAEKQLNRRILDMKIKCTRAKVGCNWVGEIRQLESHAATVCLYAEVACRLGCGQVMERDRLEQHELDDCSKRSTESKLLRLTQKLESRLQLVEKVCGEQRDKMAQLEVEVRRLKESNENKSVEITSLRESIQTIKDGHQTDLTYSLKAIEGELIRRCFCFCVMLSVEDSEWVSPPFLSHRNGYLLQLTASLMKDKSVLGSFVRSMMMSGGRPDRSPVSLSVNILPQQKDEANLDWPIYLSVDVLVLTNSDSDANAKLNTVTCYKGSPPSVNKQTSSEAATANPRSFNTNSDSDDDDDDDDEDGSLVIAHASHSFSCRLLILKISHGLEPPTVMVSKKNRADPIFPFS